MIGDEPSVNEVRLIGRIGEEPRFAPDDRALSFRVRTIERWNDRDGAKQERTEWHSVLIFDRGAQAMKGKVFLGCRVYIEGSLRTRRHEDKPVVEINARRIVPLSSPQDAGDAAGKGIPPCGSATC